MDGWTRLAAITASLFRVLLANAFVDAETIR